MATVKTNLTTNGKITSIEEALDASGLLFAIGEAEVMGSNGIFVPDRKILFREDTNDFLGLVGSKYTAIPNTDAMAFADAIVKHENAIYTEAISKDNGAVSIIKATYDKRDEVAKGDILERMVVVTNGHDAKTGFKVSFEMKRLVCLNGLTTNEAQSTIAFKHTLNVNSRMEEALKIMDASHKYFDSFVATAKRMNEKAVDKAMVEKFLNGLYGNAPQNDKKKAMIEDLFQNGKGNYGGNSLWNLYNGGTEFYTHFDSTNSEKRMESLYFGTGAKKNAQAWDLAVSML